MGCYTRPKHIDDKRGKAGDQIQLYSNFFKMEMLRNCSLHQYDVTYSPEIHKKMRTALLNDHDDLIGQVCAFDGHILFLPKRLQEKTRKLHLQANVSKKVIIFHNLSHLLALCHQGPTFDKYQAATNLVD